MIWNATEVGKALSIVGPCQHLLLLRLKVLLDTYHGTPRSVEYYDLLLGDWLMHFAHATYAVYVDVIGEAATPTAGVRVPVFPDFNSYIRALTSGEIPGAHLRQQVARILAPEKSNVVEFARAVCTVGSQPNGVMEWAKRNLKRTVFSTLGRGDAPFVICIPYFRDDSPGWTGTLWKWRNWARQDNFQYPVNVTVDVDVDWRRKQGAAVSGTTFQDVLCALLPVYLPVAYLEAFVPYRQKAKALRLRRPKVLYTANGLVGHTLFKSLAADWREEGTRILDHQHGGGYGLDRIHALEEYETRVADRFFTWGWRGSSPKLTPLAAPFSSRKPIAPSGTGRVLLNCGSYPKNLYRIHFQPLPGTIETVIAETRVFVRELSDRPELVVRPYMVDFGWNLLHTLRQANPGLTLDDLRNSGLVSYGLSSLVVHNYLGTSWLETLAMNIPTVCFYDTSTYAFRDPVQPHIAALSSAGVLHTSGQAAATLVKSVMSDPQGWWQQKEVQDARLAFVRNYANFSGNWAAEWEAEFRQWLD